MFQLPCGDPWILAEPTQAHAYLEGAREGWSDHPEWMDFLDTTSPISDLKSAERDLYLHWWKPWLGAQRVLDVACGIGRFTHPFLDRGATVIGVDADLKSLRRCAWHAAGRPGKIDLHWSSVHALPSLFDFDLAIAAEVMCYVPEVDRALQEIYKRLRPGGTLLISMEARWGWAASQDAPAGAIEVALDGEGIVDVPGERWVQTYTEDRFREVLTANGFEVALMTPALYVLDGPLEDVGLGSASLEQLLDIEERCRVHPVWKNLNRAWIAAAVKPEESPE
jgi:2-polyprenyl-3-methyl-5-hydroxy-6-metoxy-1,4-benzoquinol methylase